MKLFTWVLRSFGPIIVFQVTSQFFGLKPAICASLFFIFIEIILITLRKQKFTPFMIFSFVLVGLFGVIDLLSDNATFFKYESAIYNLVLAGYFGISMFQDKSILEQLAEQQERIPKESYPDKTFFFRFMTSVWIMYFLGKSIAYFLLTKRFSLQEFSLLRMLFGTVSFYVLLGMSLGFSKQIWILLLKLKWMPSTRGA